MVLFPPRLPPLGLIVVHNALYNELIQAVFSTGCSATYDSSSTYEETRPSRPPARRYN